jgi:hypothetical protein
MFIKSPHITTRGCVAVWAVFLTLARVHGLRRCRGIEHEKQLMWKDRTSRTKPIRGGVNDCSIQKPKFLAEIKVILESTDYGLTEVDWPV